MVPVKDPKPITDDLKKSEWAINPYSEKFGDRGGSSTDGNPALVKRARTLADIEQPKADKSDGQDPDQRVPLEESQAPPDDSQAPLNEEDDQAPMAADNDPVNAPAAYGGGSESDSTLILGEW